MLCVIFEGYVMNKYCSYDVPRSECKYIDCNVTDPLGYLTIGVTFKNKFEIGDWRFVLRSEATIVIEHIDAFPLCL